MSKVKKEIKRPSFEEFKKKLLQNEEVRKEYELLLPEFEFLMKFIKARNKIGVSNNKLVKNLTYNKNN